MAHQTDPVLLFLPTVNMKCLGFQVREPGLAWVQGQQVPLRAPYPPLESSDFSCAKLDNTEKSLPRTVVTGRARVQLLVGPLVGYSPALPDGIITENVPVYSCTSAENLDHVLNLASGISLGQASKPSGSRIVLCKNGHQQPHVAISMSIS